MASKDVIMKLARLLIAVAWADGRISASEVNVLKDLIYSWGDIDEEDWVELEAYMDSPVRDPERERLLDDLAASISTAREKRLVVETLTRLIESDGHVDPEESLLLNQIREALDERSVGLGTFFKSLLGGAVQKRSASPGAREERLDDFIRNGIYFQLVSETEVEGVKIDLPPDEAKKVCLAAGLLAQVAWIDESIDEEERDAMSAVLGRRWRLDARLASLVSRIALDRVVKGLDYYRLTRTFFESTSREERVEFLDCLFELANSAGKTSFEEIEGIRRISKSLKLTHEDFIQAKLSVAAEDRAGL